ncbi:MAG TPA: PAS domain S-box protein [Kineosporiaceae bacterium]|nr:PAS domain S-box protein [Kineosporiaceae bacterium]
MAGAVRRDSSAAAPDGGGADRANVHLGEVLGCVPGTETPFRALLDGAPDAVVLTDAEGMILLVNKQAEVLFGYPRAQLLGRGVEQLIPDGLRERHPGHRARYATDPRTRPMGAGLDLRARRRDGTEFPVDIALSSFVTERGELVVTAAVRDVTDRAELERQLRRSREEAVAANVAKSEFLSRMSHELRTPLNAVLGFAQLLELDELSPEQQEAVSQISRAGRHLLNLINEVLDISRIESGQLTLSREPVSLRQVVQETLPLVRPLAAARRITLAHADLADCGQYVMADHQRLKQVLINLLSNAVKYNRDGGRVDLDWSVEPAQPPGPDGPQARTGFAGPAGPDGPTAQADGDGAVPAGPDGPTVQADGDGAVPPGTQADGGEGMVRVFVRDTGPGIPAAHLPRLFTPFDRLGAEHLDVDGSGVGLAISLKLVEAMGGRLEVNSREGRGSTFTVVLEAAEEALPDEDLLAFPVPQPRNSRVVLYVEDNLSNLRLMERVVARRPSWRLVHALHGSLAVDLARGQRADLVLLDLHLPGMSGTEVLARLRADPATRHVPVYIVSADATRSQKERLLEAGADGYLTKPIEVSELLGVLDRVDAQAEGLGRDGGRGTTGVGRAGSAG